MEDHESDVYRKEREEIDDIFFRQPPLIKRNLPVEDLGTTLPPKKDPIFELKPLPDDLNYAYIDDKKIYCNDPGFCQILGENFRFCIA
jgi:hypothetical protein